MHHVLEALTRWMAPILTFTAEELWQQMSENRERSVFFSQWYEKLEQTPANAELDNDFWQQVLQTREAVSRELETLRNEKIIGSSLDAEVDLYCDEKLHNTLAKLEDELRFVLITSYARIHPLADKPEGLETQSLKDGQTLAIAAGASQHEKCIRCWHHREDVGSDNKHPEICGRCIENVDGTGEVRQYA